MSSPLVFYVLPRRGAAYVIYLRSGHHILLRCDEDYHIYDEKMQRISDVEEVFPEAALLPVSAVNMVMQMGAVFKYKTGYSADRGGFCGWLIAEGWLLNGLYEW